MRLMARAAGTDREAQRALAARLLPRVRRLSRSLLANAADAEDAVQTTLLEVLRSAHTYQGRSTIERWADRVGVRVVMSIARERRRAAGRLDEADVDTIPHAGGGASSQADASAISLLSKLSPILRETVALHHVMDYTVPEIADLLDVSPNTVKDRLLRGREHLRRIVRRAGVVDELALVRTV
jgi:RNA polymerase sigma-70 factor (ECF subfamily)